ncbi:TAXI family TRAP transporter solute-binding subunit [Pelagibius sp. Alg239-R121]|uniref:TAXI family TRAP transporter solute-binding subunit n=1 Tax=Pelagibius sp. Alg239-R121 TaxID=2993448 RepID=UPI0024A652CB|nr:TAXI family TRAP transporter solute-binding subunit [Pelagibius sp. Alg239-R121]
MKLKSKLFAAAIAATMLGGAAVQSQAQEMKFFRIGTGSAGGTYFPIGGLIANAISNPPGARPCDKGGSCGVPGLVAIAVSSNASVANVNSIQAGQLEAGLAGAQTVVEAFNGRGKFEGNAKDKLRVIANLYPEDMHLTLPKGASLASIGDLKGKRVGIAQAGSGTQVTVEQILKSYDIGRDDYEAAELNNNQSAQRLADGQLDAYFYAMGTPSSALVQLGSTKGFELYKFTEAEQTAINKMIPYYVPSLIPAGTYEAVDYDVPTVAVNGLLVTSADQPDDFIYEVTKALWNDNSRKLLDNGHAKGKVIRLETALKGVLTPLHPGAERFYKEQGMIK